ncbi:hypothetical protein ACYULU_03000 [Breznakiellaceae bacterium SP9]
MKDREITFWGDLLITEDDEPDEIINLIMNSNSDIDRGIGLGFAPAFLSKAMFAGFYLTTGDDPDYLPDDYDSELIPFFPFYHLWCIQTVLFFDNLHESKSVSRLANNYELRINCALERVIDACIQAHGDMWVAPLKPALLDIHANKYNNVEVLSFEVYRDNELKAGEFGIKTGKIYTSYSGFYNENGAGSVQLLLMLRYLRDNGYVMCNFGTDNSKRNNTYKRKLGAEYITRDEFLDIWRIARVL